jgi:DNA-binding CsgD family transcriptional regulator
LAIFEQVGTRLWAAATRTELGRIGGRRARIAGLTPTEERVADLVAQGLSNAETARMLNITVKTVESTLTHVYSKLGIRSRSELAARRRKA